MRGYSLVASIHLDFIVGFESLRLLFPAVVSYFFHADQRGCVISINRDKKAPCEEGAYLLRHEV